MAIQLYIACWLYIGLTIWTFETEVDVFLEFSCFLYDPVNVGDLISGSVDDTSLMAESKEELKNLSVKVKQESGISWLKIQHLKNENHGIWPHHFMANRWGKNTNSGRFYFLGLQNHCGW